MNTPKKKKKVVKKKIPRKLILGNGAVEVRFNYADYDSRAEVKSLLKMGDYLFSLEEIYRLVRSKLKHEVTAHLKQEDMDMLEEIRRLSAITIDW